MAIWRRRAGQTKLVALYDAASGQRRARQLARRGTVLVNSVPDRLSTTSDA